MPELGGCYEEEVIRLAQDTDDENERDFRHTRLAEYLMVLVLAGSAPENLLASFQETAPDKLRQRAMWFLGNQVSRSLEDVTEEMRGRGLHYWGQRLAAASASSQPENYRQELGTIDHWCFHGALDDVWLANQILGILHIGLFPNNGHYTVEWLAKFASSNADVAVDILSRIIQQANEKRWIYLTNKIPIRSILSKGREKGTPETLDLVSRTVSYLASLGDATYLDLDLPRPDI